MRDFTNSGDMNIGGDLNISDQSQNEHKLLVNCTTEELLNERPFRIENLNIERRKKFKRILPVVGFSVLFFIIAAVWGSITGKPDFVTFVFGLGSLALGFISFNVTLEPNKFQIQERRAVEEINMILKSRRAE